MTVIQLDSSDEKKVVTEAVLTLRRGGMVVYPTETVYGLGVDATNQEAVDRLLKFKGQRGTKPILIAVSDQKMAEQYVDLNDVTKRLYHAFLPGPVAVVSRIKMSRIKRPGLGVRQGQAFSSELANGIASIDNTVGIRIPAYPLILKIIRAFGKPITSTSANVSGSRNPWCINDIIQTTPKNKLELIDLILDAGQLPKRQPSTIVDTSKEETEIVREGKVTLRALLNLEAGSRNYEENITKTEKETEEIGKKFMMNLTRNSRFLIHTSPLLIALHGPLGAGKTVFAKGIARAIGITDSIRSPSYTLVREYSLNSGLLSLNTFYHIDAWRLHDHSELQDLGLERMLKPGNVIVIEWIERMLSLVEYFQHQTTLILVEIQVLSSTKRKIKVTNLFSHDNSGN